MTQLQLVEVDARKENVTREVKAVSSSWSTLSDYCKQTFGETPNEESGSKWSLRYEIEESNIVIVQENLTRFS